MKKTQEVTCRYGITYKTTFEGSKGAIWRSFDHCTRCCCWTCFNYDCKEPRNEILPGCCNVCEIWSGGKHYCENNK